MDTRRTQTSSNNSTLSSQTIQPVPLMSIKSNFKTHVSSTDSDSMRSPVLYLVTPIDRQYYYDCLYSQAINSGLESINYSNLTKTKTVDQYDSIPSEERRWQPIPGVGEIADEEFARNYMVDYNKSVGLSVVCFSVHDDQIAEIQNKTKQKHVSIFQKPPTIHSLVLESPSKIQNEIQATPEPSSIAIPSTISHSSMKLFEIQKQLPIDAHFMDIGEHRSLLVGEHVSQVCVSHMESTNLVYIMFESDYERAIQLLKAMKCIDTMNDHEPFRPIENRLCAVANRNEWLRGRCQSISDDKQFVKVQYIDWGNTVNMKTQDIRRLPNKFYNELACCLPCRLDGVHEIALDKTMTQRCSDILMGTERGHFDLDMIVTKAAKMTELAHIVLLRKSINLNDEIDTYLPPSKPLSEEQHLIEQFSHELPLVIGEQYRALLSSFSGKDNSFYMLIDNNGIEPMKQVLNQMSDEDNRPLIIRPLMMICAKYDGNYARAWIKSIEGDECQVFYVDWGNEERISKANIRACPEAIRHTSWLANRVQFHNEQLTEAEFDEFWKTLESDYCQVLVIDQFIDHYTIEIKYDYISMLRKRRAAAIDKVNF